MNRSSSIYLKERIAFRIPRHLFSGSYSELSCEHDLLSCTRIFLCLFFRFYMCKFKPSCIYYYTLQSNITTSTIPIKMFNYSKIVVVGDASGIKGYNRWYLFSISIDPLLHFIHFDYTFSIGMFFHTPVYKYTDSHERTRCMDT